jgi:hypothetical protein
MSVSAKQVVSTEDAPAALGPYSQVCHVLLLVTLPGHYSFLYMHYCTCISRYHCTRCCYGSQTVVWIVDKPEQSVTMYNSTTAVHLYTIILGLAKIYFFRRAAAA